MWQFRPRFLKWQKSLHPSCYFRSIELPGASAVESKRQQLPIFFHLPPLLHYSFFYLPPLQDNNWPHGGFPLPAEIHFGEQLLPLPVLHLQLLLQLSLRRLEVFIGKVIEVHVARHDEPAQENTVTFEWVQDEAAEGSKGESKVAAFPLTPRNAQNRSMLTPENRKCMKKKMDGCFNCAKTTTETQLPFFYLTVSWIVFLWWFLFVCSGCYLGLSTKKDQINWSFAHFLFLFLLFLRGLIFTPLTYLKTHQVVKVDQYRFLFIFS